MEALPESYGYPVSKLLFALDHLRETGAMNMFGAAPWLERTFDLDSKEAKEVLAYWMKTFTERHPQ